MWALLIRILTRNWRCALIVISSATLYFFSLWAIAFSFVLQVPYRSYVCYRALCGAGNPGVQILYADAPYLSFLAYGFWGEPALRINRWLMRILSLYRTWRRPGPRPAAGFTEGARDPFPLVLLFYKKLFLLVTGFVFSIPWYFINQFWI